jgi:arylformamidase
MLSYIADWREKMKKIFLSYSLSPSSPSYGNSDPLKLEKTKDLSCGDSCNQLRFTMSNHLGTHIDSPSHFDAGGKTIDQYPPEFWFFKRVALLEITARPGELIEIEPFMTNIPRDTDALLVKTGFCYKRTEQVYWENNPGISAKSGVFLRANFPQLKVIGLDVISLSSYAHRAEGRLAHKEFLGADRAGNPILIIEDMDLTQLKLTPSSLVVAPLRGDGFDGAPVTVFAELEI